MRIHHIRRALGRTNRRSSERLHPVAVLSIGHEAAPRSSQSCEDSASQYLTLPLPVVCMTMIMNSEAGSTRTEPTSGICRMFLSTVISGKSSELNSKQRKSPAPSHRTLWSLLTSTAATCFSSESLSGRGRLRCRPKKGSMLLSSAPNEGTDEGPGDERLTVFLLLPLIFSSGRTQFAL